jgi:hypothetical protein
MLDPARRRVLDRRPGGRPRFGHGDPVGTGLVGTGLVGTGLVGTGPAHREPMGRERVARERMVRERRRGAGTFLRLVRLLVLVSLLGAIAGQAGAEPGWLPAGSHANTAIVRPHAFPPLTSQRSI